MADPDLDDGPSMWLVAIWVSWGLRLRVVVASALRCGMSLVALLLGLAHPPGHFILFWQAPQKQQLLASGSRRSSRLAAGALPSCLARLAWPVLSGLSCLATVSAPPFGVIRQHACGVWSFAAAWTRTRGRVKDQRWAGLTGVLWELGPTPPTPLTCSLSCLVLSCFALLLP